MIKAPRKRAKGLLCLLVIIMHTNNELKKQINLRAANKQEPGSPEALQRDCSLSKINICAVKGKKKQQQKVLR